MKETSLYAVACLIFCYASNSFCSASCVGAFLGTPEMRPADMLRSEVSAIHLCNYSLVEFVVAHVYRQGCPEFRMIILPLISMVQEIIGF
jgi:hypothetical protein